MVDTSKLETAEGSLETVVNAVVAELASLKGQLDPAAQAKVDAVTAKLAAIQTALQDAE